LPNGSWLLSNNPWLLSHDPWLLSRPSSPITRLLFHGTVIPFFPPGRTTLLALITMTSLLPGPSEAIAILLAANPSSAGIA
jgi:hypothetical protein